MAGSVAGEARVGEIRAATLPSPTCAMPSRAELLERMASEEFDLLVIGGGATGAGVAHDAATRGLKVALVERGDFGSGTSSRSTKLIHGGLRYLAQAFQSKIPPNTLLDVVRHLRFEPDYLRIVQADLAERAWMIDSAPFMARPIPMMVPLYKWWEVPMFFFTGKLYDFIAGAKRGVPPSRIIPPDEALFQMPGLRNADLDGNALVGGLVIYDGQQNDARMNLCIVLSALQQGAVCANHVELEALLAAAGAGTPLSGARVRDRRSGRAFEVRAKQVVNACGVFSDKVRQMAEPSAEAIMVPSYGTHLVLPEYAGSERMGMVWFTQDGRVLYLLPWEGSTIAGTTDTAGEIAFEPASTRADGEFILGECNRLLKEPLGPDAVRSSWAGIRPLVRKPGAAVGDTKALSRDHVVETLAASGLVTVAGGKWTTYRKMAEDTVDACLARNPALRAAAAPCSTLGRRLIGSDVDGAVCGGRFERITATLRDDVGLDAAVAAHLLSNYGTRALQLVDLARAESGRFARRDERSGQLGLRRLHPQYPHLEAEVAFACRHEFAETAVDVLAHRTRLCFLSADVAREALPRVVEIMAEEKGWSDAHAQKETEQAIEFLRTMTMPAA